MRHSSARDALLLQEHNVDAEATFIILSKELHTSGTSETGKDCLLGSKLRLTYE